MDREYDSEAIHQQIRKDLHAGSMVPLRSWNADYGGGTCRQEMAVHFADVRYPKRHLVDINSPSLKESSVGI